MRIQNVKPEDYKRDLKIWDVELPGLLKKILKKMAISSALSTKWRPKELIWGNIPIPLASEHRPTPPPTQPNHSPLLTPIPDPLQIYITKHCSLSNFASTSKIRNLEGMPSVFELAIEPVVSSKWCEYAWLQQTYWWFHFWSSCL